MGFRSRTRTVIFHIEIQINCRVFLLVKFVEENILIGMLLPIRLPIHGMVLTMLSELKKKYTP